MDDELYKANILDHYHHPHRKGALPLYDVKRSGDNPSCGDDLTLYLKWGSNGSVQQIGWEGSGCAISQATASMLADQVVGKDKIGIMNIRITDIYELLGIPIGESREKCAKLALCTLHDAVEKGNVDRL